MNKVLIVDTLYSLMLYVLINKNWENTFFLFGSNLTGCYKIKTKKKYIFSSKIKVKDILFILKLNKKLNKSIIYGQGQIFLNIFLKKNHFIELEDGLLNYKKIIYKKNLRYYLRKIINRNFEIAGDKNYIKKIYLTGLAPIPEEILNKVELINLKELWSKKTIEEQNKILNIFSFDLNIKERIKGRDIILFTQPLSEDNVITEEEKIDLYLKIVKKYSKERLIIKIHPREKTNYKKIFNEYVVLDTPFPFEILNLLDIKFSKAITIFSTAALNLGKEVKVDFYGTEIHPKILERFGSCDNIMKRNCFLKEE